MHENSFYRTVTVAVTATQARRPGPDRRGPDRRAITASGCGTPGRLTATIFSKKFC